MRHDAASILGSKTPVKTGVPLDAILDTNTKEPDGIRRYHRFRKCPEMLTIWHEKRLATTGVLGLQNRGLGVRVPPLLPRSRNSLVISIGATSGTGGCDKRRFLFCPLGQ